MGSIVAIGGGDQVFIDGYLAEIVDDHRDPFLRATQYMIHQRRLARTQVTAHDGHRNALRIHRA